ncbi:MAG TPA: 50S ribosomal protein L21 [Clostridiales bacterium]|nr:50S ribosomal protein L21 [Clostridiales bacterium]
MYAVVDNGGHQYKVKVGDVFRIEKIKAEQGSVIDLKPVLVVQDDKVLTGADAEQKTVKAEVLGVVKGEKVTVFKYKPKKNYRKKQGHRQKYTELKILSID